MELDSDENSIGLGEVGGNPFQNIRKVDSMRSNVSMPLAPGRPVVAPSSGAASPQQQNHSSSQISTGSRRSSLLAAGGGSGRGTPQGAAILASTGTFATGEAAQQETGSSSLIRSASNSVRSSIVTSPSAQGLNSNNESSTAALPVAAAARRSPQSQSLTQSPRPVSPSQGTTATTTSILRRGSSMNRGHPPTVESGHSSRLSSESPRATLLQPPGASSTTTTLVSPGGGGSSSIRRKSSFNHKIDYRYMNLDSDEDFGAMGETSNFMKNVFSVKGGSHPHPIATDDLDGLKELKRVFPTKDESMDKLVHKLGLSPEQLAKQRSKYGSDEDQIEVEDILFPGAARKKSPTKPSSSQSSRAAQLLMGKEKSSLEKRPQRRTNTPPRVGSGGGTPQEGSPLDHDDSAQWRDENHPNNNNSTKGAGTSEPKLTVTTTTSSRATTPTTSTPRRRRLDFSKGKLGAVQQQQQQRFASTVVPRKLKSEGRKRTAENIRRLRSEEARKRSVVDEQFRSNMDRRRATQEDALMQGVANLPDEEFHDDTPASAAARRKWDPTNYSYEKVVIFDDIGDDEATQRGRSQSYAGGEGGTPSPQRLLRNRISGPSQGYLKDQARQEAEAQLLEQRQRKELLLRELARNDPQEYARYLASMEAMGHITPQGKNDSPTPVVLSAVDATIGTAPTSNTDYNTSLGLGGAVSSTINSEVVQGSTPSPAPRPLTSSGRVAGTPNGRNAVPGIVCDLTPRHYDTLDVPPAVSEKLQQVGGEHQKQQQSRVKNSSNGTPNKRVQVTDPKQQQPQAPAATSGTPLAARSAAETPNLDKSPSSVLNTTNHSVQYYLEEMRKIEQGLGGGAGGGAAVEGEDDPGIGIPRSERARAASGRPMLAAPKTPIQRPEATLHNFYSPELNLEKEDSTAVGGATGTTASKDQSPLGVYSTIRKQTLQSTVHRTAAVRERQESLISALSNDMAAVFGASQQATFRFVQRGPMETPVQLILS